MDIQLSEHFDYRKLIRFTWPSVVMMIFTSIYSVVDGIFVSNFVGKTPFAALNLMMPLLMVLGAVGFMLGTGGSALVAKTLGEGKPVKANRIFSMIIYVLVVFSVTVTVVSLFFLSDIARLLGADETMLGYCVSYCSVLLPILPAFVLQNAFQPFLVAAERPNLGLYITIATGVGNIALDALFIIGFGWGLLGAAWATAIAQAVGGLLPLVYFALPNKSPLRLCRSRFYVSSLLKAATNGMSEFMSNISMSVVAMVYNFQLMRLAGEDGVAAFGVIQYCNFIFLSVFLGYSIGSSPIVSYNYGSRNHAELQNMYRRSLRIVGSIGLLIFVLAQLLARPLATIFVGYDADLLSLTVHSFRIYQVSFLLAGFNLYASAFFTALNNGVVSAVISCTRTLVCETLAVILLPMVFGLEGIWYAITVAEVLALCLTAYYLRTLRPRYNY